MNAAFRHIRAFSLTEVIIALGLFAFCIVALLNLLTVGIQSTGQTEQRLEVANTAQSLLELRRLYPQSTNGAMVSWGLPAINPGTLPVASDVVVSEEGKVVAEASPEAAYRLSYRYKLPTFSTATGGTNTNCVNVYIQLSPLHPTGKSRAYELATSINL